MASPRSIDKGIVAPPAPQGHFSLKSSPFNAVSGKLTTQSLVVDHMKAHYRKLVKAKPAIDSGVPISYLRSQKVRDRQRREAMVRGDYRPPSASDFATPRHSSRPGSARSHTGKESRQGGSVPRVDAVAERQEATAAADQRYDEYREAGSDGSLAYDYEHRRQLSEYTRALAAGSTTLDSRPGYHRGGGGNSSEVFLRDGTIKWPPQSARSADNASGAGSSRDSSKSASRGQQLALAKDTGLRRGMSADILEKRPHKFTEPTRGFTPRTLKKDVQSRLSSYKYYNRPLKSSAEPLHSTATAAFPEDDLTGDVADSVILDETLLSRDFERGSSIDRGTVPPLEMSLDTDHMKWLKEHSAEHRLRSRPMPEANYAAANSERGAPYAGRITTNQLPEAPRAKPRNSLAISTTRHQMSREDEELMYLNFVTQVTNDILTRGVFSDRVLQQVFEEHIARQRGNLDEVQMRALLDTLRDDLGIPARQSSDFHQKVGDIVPSSTLSASTTSERSHFAKQMDIEAGGSYAIGNNVEALSASAFHKVQRSSTNRQTVEITGSAQKVMSISDVKSREQNDDVIGIGESDGESSVEADREAINASNSGDVIQGDDCTKMRSSSPADALEATDINRRNDGEESDQLQQEWENSADASPRAGVLAAAEVDDEEYSESYDFDDESSSKS